MTDPTKPAEKPPVVIPLIPDPPKIDDPKLPAAPPPAGSRYVLLRGTSILGLLCVLVSFVFFGVFLFSDKEHLHETIVLWVGVGFFGFGCHLLSRQSVKNFLSDFGKYLPRFGKQNAADPPDGQ